MPKEKAHTEDITRRSEEETQRELDPEHGSDEVVGGAEGGDDSPAADRPGWVPAKDDDSPLGDTDQHSSSERAPRHRDE